jgi:hypothetical protein
MEFFKKGQKPPWNIDSVGQLRGWFASLWHPPSPNPHHPSTSFPSTPDSQSQLITFVKTLDTKLIERLPASHSKPGPNPRRPTETKAHYPPYTITLPSFHPLEPQDLLISQVQRINDGSFSKFQEKYT